MLTLGEDGALERLRRQVGHQVEGADLVGPELLGRGPAEPHRTEDTAGRGHQGIGGRGIYGCRSRIGDHVGVAPPELGERFDQHRPTRRHRLAQRRGIAELELLPPGGNGRVHGRSVHGAHPTRLSVEDGHIREGRSRRSRTLFGQRGSDVGGRCGGGQRGGQAPDGFVGRHGSTRVHQDARFGLF